MLTESFFVLENKKYVRFAPVEMFRCCRVSRDWRARLEKECLQQLQSLTLSCSQFLPHRTSFEGCTALAKKLGGLHRLQFLTLELGDTNIEEKDCTELANMLGGLEQLQSFELDLSLNEDSIGDKGCKELAQKLAGSEEEVRRLSELLNDRDAEIFLLEQRLSKAGGENARLNQDFDAWLAQREAEFADRRIAQEKELEARVEAEVAQLRAGDTHGGAALLATPSVHSHTLRARTELRLMATTRAAVEEAIGMPLEELAAHAASARTAGRMGIRA